MGFIIVRSICWVLLRIIYSLCGGIRFEGRENVPRHGGVLITPNHLSDADPPTICFALPRTCYVMAKEELFHIRFIGWLIRTLQGFPVKRYTADRNALRRAEELLKQGEAVVIFPEGKVSEDATLQPLLPGALLVAQRADVPIVPVIMAGTEFLMPYGKLVPRPMGRRIVVRFGAPVTVADLTGGQKGGEALKRGTEQLHAIMLAMQQGKPYPPLKVPAIEGPSEQPAHHAEPATP